MLVLHWEQDFLATPCFLQFLKRIVEKQSPVLVTCTCANFDVALVLYVWNTQPMEV